MSTALSLVKARVAGEMRSINVVQILNLAEDTKDEDGDFAFDEKEMLNLVNVGALKFKDIDYDYSNVGKLKWIGFSISSGSFTYSLVLNYTKSQFVNYECAAYPKYARSNSSSKKFNISGTLISPTAVKDAFSKLKLEATAKLGTLMKTPSSCKLSRFDMVKKNQLASASSERVVVGFESVEKDSDKNPMVLLRIDVKNNAVFQLDLFGNAFDVDEDSPTDLTEDGNRAIRRSLAVKFKTFDELLSALNSNKDLIKILSELTPQVGIDARIIKLGVQNLAPLSDRALKDPEDFINDDINSYAIFKDAASRDSALEAIRKAISDNGGRIMYADNLTIKEGR